ncbi:hypothetical protein, partial [Clostridium sp.]|uniref:hypothetical protein n=1 Tax=Clostridium sp. TaxID=1506 RepID=UPI00260DF4AD
FVKLDDYLNKNIKFDYGRTVCCIKDGVIVREFKNVNDCLENGFEKSRVSSCIAGKRKSYKNFQWIYKNKLMY